MDSSTWFLAALAGCASTKGPAPTAYVEQAASPAMTVPVPKVAADLSTPDPWASYWSASAPGSFTLIAQPMITPRPEVVTTSELQVQAVHDGARIAFRLRWKDDEPSFAGHLGEYSDAVALEFPIDPQAMPPVMMGAPGMPVHIFHWRAQYQKDATDGKPTIEQLYPNASVDMYAMDFHEAAGGSKEDQEQFNPGVAVGNPQSAPKSGVDEIVAEGFSTSAVQEGHGSAGHGEWKDGWWTVVISRPLAVEGGNSIGTSGANHVAYAVWQGGKQEVGSRKSLTMAWAPLEVQ